MTRKDRQIELLKEKLRFYERLTSTKLRYFSVYTEPNSDLPPSKCYEVIKTDKDYL